ncbi:MAG: DUF2721 domain-containing protein [Formosimonas sp.]
METHISDITHAIQLAVAPVFLLTAIATLISVLNARLSRSIDRRRAIDRLIVESSDATELQHLHQERAMHAQRLRTIYLAILSAVVAALMICLVVMGAFIGALFAVEVSRAIAVLFIIAMIGMILSLMLFLREVFVMLK